MNISIIALKLLNTEFKGTLILLHINVRFLHKNFDLYEFIVSLNFLPRVICLSEICIKKDPLTNIELTNYIFVHVNSKSNTGGVVHYIRNNFNYEISQNQHVLTNSESLWITITENLLSYTVGVIYWHPSSSNVKAFIEDLSICLKELNHTNSNFYILEI